ncbi:hypothetical protein DFH27DRAFT_199726 [Peziza echinospora]|nr:hypothetical protein DFH27DRAFT_199726 [Peziza echinospora]
MATMPQYQHPEIIPPSHVVLAQDMRNRRAQKSGVNVVINEVKARSRLGNSTNQAPRESPNYSNPSNDEGDSKSAMFSTSDRSADVESIFSFGASPTNTEATTIPALLASVASQLNAEDLSARPTASEAGCSENHNGQVETGNCGGSSNGGDDSSASGCGNRDDDGSQGEEDEEDEDEDDESRNDTDMSDENSDGSDESESVQFTRELTSEAGMNSTNNSDGSASDDGRRSPGSDERSLPDESQLDTTPQASRASPRRMISFQSLAPRLRRSLSNMRDIGIRSLASRGFGSPSSRSMVSDDQSSVTDFSFDRPRTPPPGISLAQNSQSDEFRTWLMRSRLQRHRPTGVGGDHLVGLIPPANPSAQGDTLFGDAYSETLSIGDATIPRSYVYGGSNAGSARVLFAGFATTQASSNRGQATFHSHDHLSSVSEAVDTSLPTQDTASDLRCPFGFMGCNIMYGLNEVERWKRHANEHFQNHSPPVSSTCTFPRCELLFNDPTRGADGNWDDMMTHYAGHIQQEIAGPSHRIRLEQHTAPAADVMDIDMAATPRSHQYSLGDERTDPQLLQYMVANGLADHYSLNFAINQNPPSEEDRIPRGFLNTSPPEAGGARTYMLVPQPTNPDEDIPLNSRSGQAFISSSSRRSGRRHRSEHEVRR